MDPTVVAGIALGLTVIVQAIGIAFYFGTVKAKLENLTDAFDQHRNMRAERAHGDK